MNWKTRLSDNISSTNDLQKYLQLNEDDCQKMDRFLARFPMLVPQYYLDLIDWNDPHDPIRRMCIPDVQEFDLSGRFDTSGEGSNTKLQGLQHKYTQTALILSTSRCAMYCRHCFRKRLVGTDAQDESSHNAEAQAVYVREHPEINNVLISGGDAFLNDNDIIENYLKVFSEVPNVQLIRFGTRTPVVFPYRITEDPELRRILREYNQKKQIFVITHFNHPRELTAESRRAIRQLQECGIVIRNQTVLLKGVNDNSEILAALLQELTAAGVIPYYIFQCRPVAGVQAQFQVPILQGIEIVERARALQNGQGKSFRYAMSHVTGKIAILGKVSDDSVIMKYHQAKDPENAGKIFEQKLTPDQCWLDD